MPSSSSGPSSESSGSPAPTRKKRPVEAELSDSSDNHDSDTSDASSVDEEDSDAPQPLRSTEITVLSHAERRRQKKKQKQNQLAASGSPRKKRKLDDGTGISPPSNVGVNANAKKTTTTTTKVKARSAADNSRRQQRQNSIWVGNLSFWTTQDALRGFFDGVGTITRVHMPTRRGKQMQSENMGFAYVDFETPEAKVIAITLSEGQLDGRRLLIKDGDDFAGRPAKAKAEPSEGSGGGEGSKPVKGAATAEGRGLSKTAQKILRVQKQPPAPTLFLGNLGFETTERSIQELFETHRYWGHKDKGKGVDVKAEKQETSQGEGEVQSGNAAKSNDVWIRKIRMGTFEDSGACKGFAFVDFTSIEHATEALVNSRNHRLHGRDLVVEYASPDAVRRGGGRNPKGDRDQKSRSGSGKILQKGSASEPYTKQRRPRHTEQEDDAEVAEIPTEATMAPCSRRPDRAGHDRPHTRRAKPGAALAHAQRQSAAILPSQGQKIVF